LSDTTAVTDNPAESRFQAVVDGHLAVLDYVLDGSRLVLVHTGVPDELGGQGLGGQLVRAALHRAVAEGLTLVPECPFARGWLEKHPDEAATASIDWPASAP